MDLKSIASAIHQIAAEKGIPAEKVIDAIETAMAAAYKREYRKKAEIVKAEFDTKTGETKFWQIKLVTDPEKVRIVSHNDSEEQETEHASTPDDPNEEVLPRYNPDRHILLKDAQKIKPDSQPGDELRFPLEDKENFGRIAAQTAKQVILQGIREAERASIKEEFADKQGQIVSGIVQRFERGNIYIDIGRATGLMFESESLPNERYKVGQRMRFYVLSVQDEERRPGILLSRSHPKFVTKLFEIEVPEVAEGIVEIKSIAREAGSRTKIAVISNQDGVDPVGSVVGQRGTRVMAVTNELGTEKIDVVEWSEDPEKFLSNALSPAKIKMVELTGQKEARVLVSEDQLSLAIGKGGQNVRLAAKLTGWKIDVRSQSNPEEMQEGGVATDSKENSEENEEAANQDEA